MVPVVSQDGGWIKLWRSCENCAALDADDAEGVWSRLLRRAAHKPASVNWKGQTISLEAGQLCVSVRAWSRERGTSHKRLRAIFGRFQDEGMITAKALLPKSASPVHHFSGTQLGTLRGTPGLLVTICNYEKYQIGEMFEGTHLGTTRAQEGHTRGTQNKKVRTEEDKKDKPRTNGNAKPDFNAEFEEHFWPAWTSPARKIAKGQARKAYHEWRGKGVAMEVILAGVARSLASWRNEGRRPEKTPYPATWINGECWDDDLFSPARQSDDEWGLYQ